MYWERFLVPFIYLVIQLTYNPSTLCVTYTSFLCVQVLSNGGKITPGDMFADGRSPGDIGFDPLNLGGDDTAVRRFELAELKHARLAMIGLGGLVHQEILTKQATFEQLANFQPLN